MWLEQEMQFTEEYKFTHLTLELAFGNQSEERNEIKTIRSVMMRIIKKNLCDKKSQIKIENRENKSIFNFLLG